MVCDARNYIAQLVFPMSQQRTEAIQSSPPLYAKLATCRIAYVHRWSMLSTGSRFCSYIIARDVWAALASSTLRRNGAFTVGQWAEQYVCINELIM